jgi:hypothetical protein
MEKTLLLSRTAIGVWMISSTVVYLPCSASGFSGRGGNGLSLATATLERGTQRVIEVPPDVTEIRKKGR